MKWKNPALGSCWPSSSETRNSASDKKVNAKLKAAAPPRPPRATRRARLITAAFLACRSLEYTPARRRRQRRRRSRVDRLRGGRRVPGTVRHGAGAVRGPVGGPVGDRRPVAAEAAEAGVGGREGRA